jgi:hypothetical protein
MVTAFTVLDRFNTSALDVDSPSYILIAQGRASEVNKPFSNRVLEPYLAMAVSKTTGASLERAFRGITIVSFATLVWLTGYLLSLNGALVALPTILLSAATLQSFHNIYLAEMLHGALLAAFLVSLVNQWLVSSAILMLVMYTAREATILLTIIAVAIAWWHGQRRWAAAWISGLFIATAHRSASHAPQRRQRARDSNGSLSVPESAVQLSSECAGHFIWTNTVPYPPKCPSNCRTFCNSESSAKSDWSPPDLMVPPSSSAHG